MGKARFHFIWRRRLKSILRFLLIGILLTPILWLLLTFGITTRPELVLFAFISFAGCFVIAIWIPSVILAASWVFDYHKKHRKGFLKDLCTIRNSRSSVQEKTQARLRLRPRHDGFMKKASFIFESIGKKTLLTWLIVNIGVILATWFFDISIPKVFLEWFSS